MMLMRLFLLVGLVSTASVLTARSPLFFRHFTEEDGLSSNQVTCILQAKNGYLWVGTNYGLNRYNGHEFKQYLPNTKEQERTISHEYITQLAEDDAGYIWIATRNGLNRYDPYYDRFQVWHHDDSQTQGLPSSWVNTLLTDGNQVWVACDNRDLAVLNRSTMQWAVLPWKSAVKQLLPKVAAKDYLNIGEIMHGQKGHLWLNTNVGLFDFEVNNQQFEVIPAPLGAISPYFSTKSFCPDQLFLGSWDHDVICYNPCDKTWQQARLPLNRSLKNGFKKVYRVAGSGDDRWVLTEQGLFQMEVATGRIEALPNTKAKAPFGPLEAFFEATDGTCWIGGVNGLWQLDPRLQHFQFQALDTTSFASYYNRYARFLDIPSLNRRLVLDLYKGQLLVLDAGRWQRSISLGGQATVLKRDTKSRIWVSGGRHLYQLDSQNLKLSAFPVPRAITSAHTILDFEEDAAGDYWLAVSDLGLFRYQQTTKRWSAIGNESDFLSINIWPISSGKRCGLALTILGYTDMTKP
jgi:ligand-binding sensor domain-containing protein